MKMKFTAACVALLLMIVFLIPMLISCTDGGTASETAAPDVSTPEPPLTAEPGATPGVEYTSDASSLGCTAFSAASSDMSIATASVTDGSLTVTSHGIGNAVITVKNTYGEEFDLQCSVGTRYDIMLTGKYEPDTISANVLDFGAKPNDAVNDTAKIQAAIDSLADGGTVYIPRGVYIISRIQYKEGVTLRLEGLLADYTKPYAESGAREALAEGRLAVLCTDKSGVMFLNHARGDYGRNGCSNFGMTGGMVDMEGKVPAMIWCCADGVLLHNVIMKDCPNNHAIQITGSSNVEISDCMFAGYNYSSNNTTSEEIQIEQSHPGAIGSSNPASVFDDGEYFVCSNVKITGCYFGRSDEYDAQTYAIGHHGQRNRSAVTGCEISGNVFDNCRCSAIRYPAFSDVIITGNRFISDRANSVSPEAMPAMIYLYLTSSDVSVAGKTIGGTSASVYYSRSYSNVGSIGTDVCDNVFYFGALSQMDSALMAKSNTYSYDASVETGHYFTSWYTTPARLYIGYLTVNNVIADLTVTGNKITADNAFGGNGQYFYLYGIKGLKIADNSIEGKSCSVVGAFDGVNIRGARLYNCVSQNDMGRQISVSVGGNVTKCVVLTGAPSGEMRLRCRATAIKKLTVICDGGKIDMTVDDNGNLILTPQPDGDGRVLGVSIVSGTATVASDGVTEYSDNLTLRVSIGKGQ